MIFHSYYNVQRCFLFFFLVIFINIARLSLNECFIFIPKYFSLFLQIAEICVNNAIKISIMLVLTTGIQV